MEKRKKLSCFACGNGNASSYFRIPLNENIRRIWLQQCNIDVTLRDVPVSARLCDNHFTESSFRSSKAGDFVRKRLKRTALPIPFLGACENKTFRHSPLGSSAAESKSDKEDNSRGMVKGKYCFVCGRRSENVKRSYFTFPKDETVRKQWFEILGTNHRGRPSMFSELRLCDQHFSAQDINEHPITKRRWLKRGALPIIGEDTTSETCADLEIATSENGDLCSVTDVVRSDSDSNSALDLMNVEVTISDDSASLDLSIPPLMKMITSSLMDTSIKESSGTCDKESQTTPEDFLFPHTPSSQDANTNFIMPSTTTASCPVTMSISEHSYAEPGSRCNQRAYMKPRYVGDVHALHLVTPMRAKQCFEMNKRIIERQRVKINRLVRNLRTARAKVTNMSELMTRLKTQGLSNENSANNIIISLDHMFRNLYKSLTCANDTS